MKPRFSYLWIFTLVLLGMDRISKHLILLASEADRLPVDIIPGFARLVHVTNTGIAFGIFSHLEPRIMNPLLVGIGLLVCGVISYLLLFKQETRLTRISLHLLLAGAVGNIWDRLAWGNVVDFIDVFVADKHWPSFNVADSCISIGLVLMLIASFGGRDRDVSEAA